MHFGFALKLSDIDLWNINLLDTHLDLLSPGNYTDIPSKHFVSIMSCLHNVLFVSIISSRRLQDMSSRHIQDMSWISLQDVFSVTIFRLPKRLEDVLQDVFKTSLQDTLQDVFKTSLQDVLKTSSRCLGWREIVTLKTFWRCLQDMSWRRLEDVLKTKKCLLGNILFGRGV